MMRLLSIYWAGFACFEAFVRNDNANTNAGVVCSVVFWVGAEIVAAIKTRPLEQESDR